MAIERFTNSQFSGTTVASGGGNPKVSFTCTSAHNSGEKVSVVADASSTGGMTRIYLQIQNSSSSQVLNYNVAWSAGTGTARFIAVQSLTGNIPAGKFTVQFYGAGGSGGTLTIKNFRITLGAAKVVAGNPIYKTDFDDVGQSATSGSAITNSNFTKGDKITASAWNTKWGL